VSDWADYLALAAPRASLPGRRERPGWPRPPQVPREAQALVVTPMPCGGLADCGVCSVEVKRGMELACKDGPVFNL